jgi:two-component system, NarL family, nitrate/nitrite response regulator NarL
MAKGRPHVFLSARGDLLPRWLEAFPAAIGARIGERAETDVVPSAAWVRLADEPVAATMEKVRRQVGAAVPCIVLADHPNDEEALVAFAAAARGYCNTHAAPELLSRIADVVAQGGLWIGESLMQRLLRATSHLPSPPLSPANLPWDSGLTARERQVALAVAAGAANKEIARQFDITERTVKAHVSALLGKLGVRDRLQLALVVNGQRSR